MIGKLENFERKILFSKVFFAEFLTVVEIENRECQRKWNRREIIRKKRSERRQMSCSERVRGHCTLKSY